MLCSQPTRSALSLACAIFALLVALTAPPSFAGEAPSAAPASFRFQPYHAFYSGSFDPPTQGHLGIIRRIAGSGVGKLYVFVNRDGDKDFKASTSQRIAMLKAALKDLGDKVEFLAVDGDSRENLIEHLGRSKGHPFYYQFAGEDSFDKAPRSVFGHPHRKWVMMPREGDAGIEKKARELGVEVLPLQTIGGASSTKLRADIAAGRLDSPLMNPFVRPLIEQLDAYRPLSPEQAAQRESRFLESYKAEMRRLALRFPELHPEELPPPPFLAEQSAEAWQEKFVNWVVSQRKPGKAMARRLREFSYSPGQSKTDVRNGQFGLIGE